MTDPRRSVHVTPIADEREHALGPWCWCGPDETADPDAAPVYVHHAADLREVYEDLTGEPIRGKPWLTTELVDDETDDD